MFFRRKSLLERALSQPRPYDTLSFLERKVIAKHLKRHPGDVAGLPYPHRLVFLVNWLCNEINNGGVVQYFWNSTGDHYHELSAMLQVVGATEIRTALEEARAEVFGSNQVPIDYRERRAMMVEFFNTIPFNFDDDMERVSTIRPSPKCEAATQTFWQHELQLVARTRDWVASNWAP